MDRVSEELRKSQNCPRDRLSPMSSLGSERGATLSVIDVITSLSRWHVNKVNRIVLIVIYTG